MGGGPIWLINYGQSSSCLWLSPLWQEGQVYANKQCACPTTTPISNSFLKNLHSAGSCSEAVGSLHLNQAQASLALPNNAGLPNPHHCSLVRVCLVFATFLLLLNHRISGCLGTGEAKLGEGQLRGGIVLSETPLPHPWSSPSAFEMEPSHSLCLAAILPCNSQQTGMAPYISDLSEFHFGNWFGGQF